MSSLISAPSRLATAARFRPTAHTQQWQSTVSGSGTHASAPRYHRHRLQDGSLRLQTPAPSQTRCFHHRRTPLASSSPNQDQPLRKVSSAIHPPVRLRASPATHSVRQAHTFLARTTPPTASATFDPRYFLPFAAVLAFMGATSLPDSSSTATTTRIATSKPRGSGGGGGGGGGGESRSPRTISTRDEETRDDLSQEEAGLQRPFHVSVGAVQGARWTMEDEYRIANGGRFAACFDGHGGNGVSAYLRDHMYELYQEYVKLKHWEEEDTYRTPSIACHVAALRGALLEIDRRVLLNERLNKQGSTAVAVVIHLAENGQRTLLSANVGDSRAILSRGGSAVDLTRDHKPNDRKERERILAMGEEVTWDPLGHVHRVRSLSLSRAIGDRYAKPVVSGVPEIQHFPLIDGEDNEFVLLASDGLWDVMTSQEAVDYVHESIRKELASVHPDDVPSTTHLLRRSMAKRVAREALLRGSGDNTCVVIVWLSDVRER